MISKHMGIPLELATTQNFSRCKTLLLHTSQAVTQSDEATAMTLMPDVPTGLGGLARDHSEPASALAHQPAPSLPLPRCWLQDAPGAQGKGFSPERSELSLPHAARHPYASGFARTRTRWQLAVTLRGHQQQGANSSRVGAPCSAEIPWKRHGAQPRGGRCCPGEARGTLRISVDSSGLLLTSVVILLEVLVINTKRPSSFYTYFSATSLTLPEQYRLIANRYFIL